MKRVVAVLAVCAAFCCVLPVARAETVLSFQGAVDLRQGTAHLALGRSDGARLVVDARGVGSDNLLLKCNLRHINAAGFDLTSDLTMDLKLTGSDPYKRELSVELTGQETLLNFKPVRDLRMSFLLRDRHLILEKFWLGSLSARGKIELAGERRLNLSLELLPCDLEAFFDLVGSRAGLKSSSFTGTLDGLLEVSGVVRNPRFKGRLRAYDGRFKDLAYESIVLQFDGVYPQLQLQDSTVIQEGGFGSRIAGTIDLLDLRHLADQADRLERTAIISEEKGGRAWVFKRLRSQEDVVTEMKYFLMKDDRGDTSAVLGIQKSIGF